VTPEQKEIVRRSWAQILPQADATAALFYSRLFATDASSRRLFGSKDMRIQGTLFMQMLAMFIRSLDDEPGMLDAIRAAGRRHIGYGVMNSDYDGVGAALFWTVEQMLGPDFTPEVRSAWKEAYQLLATTMRQAATAVL
jgi:hemoglobin-like flavoprotein